MSGRWFCPRFPEVAVAFSRSERGVRGSSEALLCLTSAGKSHRGARGGGDARRFLSLGWNLFWEGHLFWASSFSEWLALSSRRDYN